MLVAGRLRIRFLLDGVGFSAGDTSFESMRLSGVTGIQNMGMELEYASFVRARLLICRY